MATANLGDTNNTWDSMCMYNGRTISYKDDVETFKDFYVDDIVWDLYRRHLAQFNK